MPPRNNKKVSRDTESFRQSKSKDLTSASAKRFSSRPPVLYRLLIMLLKKNSNMLLYWYSLLVNIHQA